MKRIILALILSLPLLSSCGIYSFSGTSIHSDTKTICIPYVEYKALRVNPSLSNDMTEALQDKFRKLTSLEQVDMDGDLELVCEITGFTNKKYPEEDVDKSFSAYEDYDSTQSLDAVEAGLCESIIDKLCEDIFNATVAQW